MKIDTAFHAEAKLIEHIFKNVVIIVIKCYVLFISDGNEILNTYVGILLRK